MTPQRDVDPDRDPRRRLERSIEAREQALKLWRNRRGTTKAVLRLKAELRRLKKQLREFER